MDIYGNIKEMTPGTGVYVKDYPIDFFLERARNREPFSFWKQNHAHWEFLVCCYRGIYGTSKKGFNRSIVRSEKFWKEYCVWNKAQRYGFYRNTDLDKFFEIIKCFNAALLSGKHSSGSDSDYFIAISDSGLWDYSDINCDVVSANRKRGVKLAAVADMIRAHLPDDHKDVGVRNDKVPLRGTLFKKFYRENTSKLKEFIEFACSNKAAFVGSSKPRFHGFDHISTPARDNINDADIILKKIRTWCESKKKEELKFIFLQGGYVQIWLIDTLHGEFENTFLIDIGQAIDPIIFSRTPRRWETLSKTEYGA